MTDPDHIISNGGDTVGEWLRLQYEMEHDATPADEPDAGDHRQDNREESDRE